MNLIEIKHVSNYVLKDVNLNVNAGEKIAVMGSTGAGKTSLLRSIELLDIPDTGNILIDGDEITSHNADLKNIRRKIGMIHSSANLFSHMNVVDNLCLAPVKLDGLSRRDVSRKAADLLSKAGLTTKAKVKPEKLSAGQQFRVSICRSLMMNPKALLIDDPTGDLDPAMSGEILAMIRMLSKRNITLLFVSNDVDFIRETADRVLFMSDGEIYEEGTANEILDNPKRSKTQKFMRRVKFFSVHIDSCDFDLITLQSGIRMFSERYGLRTTLAYRLQLCCEELVYEMLFGACVNAENISLDLEISYNSADSSTTIDVSGKGSEFNPFSEDITESDNVHLGVTVLRQVSKEIKYDYTDGINHISIVI